MPKTEKDHKKEFLRIVQDYPSNREVLIQRFYQYGYMMDYCNYIFSELRRSGHIQRVKGPNGNLARDSMGKYYYEVHYEDTRVPSECIQIFRIVP